MAHTHNIPAHSHTINHTHTIPAHNHTVNAHSHSTGNHTLTLNEIPTHNHGSKSLIGHVWNIAAQTANQMISANGICSEWTCDDNTSAPTSWANYQGDGFEIDATHTHNTQGGGGAHNHGNTGSTSPATNSKTLTTNQGGGTSGSAALTTNSNLSDISINPLYLALFIWRRTK